MGVLNVTPNSFSDGGRFLDPAAAVAQAQRLTAEGADILDIGAEVLKALRQCGCRAARRGARTSGADPSGRGRARHPGLDRHHEGIRGGLALETGAAIVNDVWGLQRDPDMARVVAEHDAPVIVMHNRDAADPRIDIVADVTAFFERSLAIAARASIPPERIVLDPGIGFGKTPEQSLTCIARLDAWRVYGLPLLVGASRKRFIHSVVPSEPAGRLGGSLARIFWP